MYLLGSRVIRLFGSLASSHGTLDVANSSSGVELISMLRLAGVLQFDRRQTTVSCTVQLTPSCADSARDVTLSIPQ